MKTGKNFVCALFSLMIFTGIISTPTPAFCFKGRDAVMIVSGTIVVAGGITFVIKSTKKKETSDPKLSLEISPWFPHFQKNIEADVFKNR